MNVFSLARPLIVVLLRRRESSRSQERARERLDQICNSYLKGCPLYIKHIAIGDPAREILKLIEQEKLDMVVMSTHGRKGHFGFGSVAEEVMKNSPVPVVSIPIS